MSSPFLQAAFAVVAALASLATHAATTVTVTDVPIARGIVRIAHFRPDNPVANVLHYPGGNGIINIQLNQGVPTEGRYARLLERGISVVLVDVPNDMRLAGGMSIPYRSTDQHAAEFLAVLQVVQARDNLPAWVWGFSAGGVTAASVGLKAPRSTPFGVIMMSPATDIEGDILELPLEQMQRPTLLMTHGNDTCAGTPPANGPVVIARLSATEARRHTQYSGGNVGQGGCDINGHHGLGGLETAFTTEMADWLRLNASLVQAANYQGLWWRSPSGSESGWGVNITHQGDVLFMTWFTYDTDGTGLWLVMSSGARTGPNTFSGQLHRTTGPPFNAVPFTPTQVVASLVGTATFTFTDSSNGTFDYVVNGVSQSRPITRFGFATPMPACILGATHLASPNYQAIWWASPDGSESGWGVNLTHQGDVLFATWFTYGLDGRAMWLVMSDGRLTAPGTYTGDLYRTTGPAFSAVPWNGPAVATRVGSGTFTFTSATAGTFAYTVGDVTQSKAITRYSFATPASVCR